MVIFTGLGDEFSSSILDRLQCADFAIWESGQNAVAIIKPGRDKGVDNGLSCLEGEMFSNMADSSDVEIS